MSSRSRQPGAGPVASMLASMDYAPAPESPASAEAWLAGHGRRFGHFIGGSFTRTRGTTFATIAPGSGKQLARCAHGSAADVNAAVKAAAAAQPAWAALPPAARARHMYALSRTVQRNARLLAVLESMNNGKPIRESRDIDVPLLARHFLYHAGWARLMDEEFAAFQPVGVCGQIIPWNFPLLMLAWKVAPALALGNTVVLKPAEQTPLTALLFAELAARAGLPAGVLNVVTGDGRTGAALADAEGIGKLAFTGSTEIGRSLRARTAGRGLSLTLELGGKSPLIVFDDADLDAAVEGVVDGAWFNQGEVCCAGSRLLVQEGVAAQLHRKLARRLETMRVGDPLDKSTDIGAIVSKVQLERIERLVRQGVADGAKLHQAAGKLPAGGCYYAPTLLADTPLTSEAMVEEIFGPVIVSTTFRTPDEAVALANNTRYGLAASIFSETIGLALDIAPQLAAGVVWINATNLFDASSGFGGYRESGFGREGGREGAYEYLKPKAWARRRPRPASSPIPPAQAPASVRGIDRTAKQYIGGRQVRPDGGYSYPVVDARGKVLAEAAAGNRKDIRNAVAAARKAEGWTAMGGAARSQVLYFIAENLAARSAEFAARLQSAGASKAAAVREVAASVDRLLAYAGWADKYEGRVHQPPLHGVVLAMREALGVVGISCPPEAPLLALVSLLGPNLAAGNRTVVLPCAAMPLAATDLYQVFDTSDLPAGACNIVTGDHAVLLPTMAEHLDVDGLWVFGSASESELAERASCGNLKRVLADHGLRTDWYDPAQAEGPILLRHAVQVKNVWVPYGI